MERTKQGHVLVLTYPAQGHINPLLQFAKRLVSKGLKTTLVTTHYIINSIRAEGLDVKPISDGYDDGGFSQAPSLEAYLDSFKAVGSRTLTELIINLNKSTSPSVNCLVYDSLLTWAFDVAKKLDICKAAFLTNSACVCSILWYLQKGIFPLPVKPEDVPVSVPGLPPLGLSDMLSSIAQPPPISAYLALCLEKFSSLDQDDWVFVNSFQELEIEVAKAMSRCWPVQMVGPMVPSAYLDQQIEGDRDYGGNFWKPTGDQCVKWLDGKPPKSVIYVSFGSMTEIASKQVEEIALSLKAGKKPFLWVVKDTERNKLLNDLLASVGDKGLIVTWCNQVEVLAHRAVGCFITHCGWNSILEAVSLGVPMVAIPQRADQPTNAMCVEKVWKVGVRAKKDEEGTVTREELEMCIREVMDGPKSQDIGRNASNLREVAKRAVSWGGSSDGNINKFMEVLQKAK